MLCFVANCEWCGKEVWGMAPPTSGIACLACEYIVRRADEVDALLAYYDPPGVGGPGWTAPND